MMDPSVPSPFRLKSDQVDIWIAAFSIVSDDMQLAYRRLLSEAENARSQRFVPQGARHQYLVGRALVRAALSKYTNTPEQQWVFETNAYGRPYVAYPKAFRCLQFSLSHTEGMVACAIAKGYGIGIDVEKIRSDVDPMTLAPSAFAPSELAALVEAAQGERIQRFFSFWTLKESYIKARGLGLSIPLDAFWFELNGPSPRVHFNARCPDDPRRWQFRQYAVSSNHYLAIAIATTSPGHKRSKFAFAGSHPL